MQAGGAGDAGAQREALALLENVRRITVEQLSTLPDALYPSLEADIEQALQAAIDRRLGLGGAQRDDLMLLKMLRQRSSTHAMRFRALLGAQFDLLAGKIAEQGDVGLRLIGEDELDFRLAGERMAEELAQRLRAPLDELFSRFTALAGLLGRAGQDNPIAPSGLAAVLVQTFRDVDLTRQLQALLVLHYHRVLEATLPELYRRAGEILRTVPMAAESPPGLKGFDMVTPRVPPTADRPHAGAHAQVDALARAPGTVTEDGVLEEPIDAVQMMQHLRELLHTARGHPAIAGRPAAPAGTTAGVAATGAFFSRNWEPRRDTAVLDHLARMVQDSAPAAMERALGGDSGLQHAIRAQLADTARSVGLELDTARLAYADADAIDLVAMLFEALAGQQGIGQAARNVFARLVMPYVRVAMRDPRLFVDPEHPGRRLLDALSQGLGGNQGVTRNERELIEQATEQAARIANDFNDDLGVLQSASDALEPLLLARQRAADLAERRACETAEGRERLLQARDRAATEVVQRTSQRPLTPAIARFLASTWRHHFEQMLLRGGTGSPRVADAGTLADGLVALDVSAATPASNDVADRMLALLPQLSQCLADSGVEEGGLEEWLARIARAIAFPDMPRQAAAFTVASEDAMAGGADATTADPAMEARMRVLRPGDLMLLVEADGEAQVVKVAWSGADSGRILLVDRRGQRRLLASPAQLAVLFGQGRLRFNRHESPFDRALRDVGQRLDTAAQE